MYAKDEISSVSLVVKEFFDVVLGFKATNIAQFNILKFVADVTSLSLSKPQAHRQLIVTREKNLGHALITLRLGL